MKAYPKGTKQNPYVYSTKPPATLAGIKDDTEDYRHLNVGDDFWFKNTYTGKLTKGIVVAKNSKKGEIEAYVSRKAYRECKRVESMRSNG